MYWNYRNPGPWSTVVDPVHVPPCQGLWRFMDHITDGHDPIGLLWPDRLLRAWFSFNTLRFLQFIRIRCLRSDWIPYQYWQVFLKANVFYNESKWTALCLLHPKSYIITILFPSYCTCHGIIIVWKVISEKL